MKCKPDELDEYTKSLLKSENDGEEEKAFEMNSDESSALSDDGDDINEKEDETKVFRDRTSDVIFVDASKSKSDCVILDIAPVNKLCAVFDGSGGPQLNTTMEVPQVDTNTSIKPYLDTISLSEPYCRVCHCTGDEQLISPCYCSGSVKWVHETCLVKWMKSSFKESCELCRKNIEIAKRRKPLSKVRFF